MDILTTFIVVSCGTERNVSDVEKPCSRVADILSSVMDKANANDNKL